jgi:2-oxo-4-hydroxy-4-carboxy-5-ureidoimidazoline decarboxylase
MTKLTMAEANGLSAPEFEARLGHVFEHAPWVVARAVSRRPFADREQLHRALVEVIGSAGEDEKLALLRGHPELAGKAAIAGDLTADSKREQSGAGLDRLTPAEYQRFHALNDAYKTKFGFPFIVAVKGKTKHDILAAFAARLDSTRERELATALAEVGKIGAFRLADIVAD